ncbi:MAG: sigma-70 family RNA polymerase sigma factor [Clostridia bacterium]|nr:sigma-70 family RNA polymerase sigma factor [Clostridia bacterium]
MEDKEIVDLYWERSESAIAETEKKYGRYCHYIAYQILENNEDAKEIVNDTYLKTWQTIPPKRPDALKPYVGMISRQLALNAYEEQHTQKRGQLTLVLDELAECLPSSDEEWNVVSGIALHDSLNIFLRGLPPKTRNVFIRRYWYTSSIAEIAEEYSMKESAVAMLLLRTRNKLKTHLQKEGFNV